MTSTVARVGPSVLTPDEYELRGGSTPHSAPIEDIGRIARKLREKGVVRVAYRASLPSMGAGVYTAEDVRRRLDLDLAELVRRVGDYKIPVNGRVMSEPSTSGSFDVHIFLIDQRVVIECDRQDIEIEPSEQVIEAVRQARRELEKQAVIAFIFRLSWNESMMSTPFASDELLWFEAVVLRSALERTAGRIGVGFAIRGWEIVSVKDGDNIRTTETFVVTFTRGQ